MQVTNNRTILEGIAEAKRGNTLLGLQLFTGSIATSHLPEAKAWYGYCLAREKNDFSRGISLCNEAIQIKPRSSDIFLALGRIYLLAGVRASAVKTLKQGLKLDNNREIYRLLNCIGIRKPPVFRCLKRSSKVNIVSGSLFSRIGLR